MPDEWGNGLSRDQRVDQIIAEYLKAADAGNAPQRDELLAAHPSVAEELRAFFADHDAIAPMADPPPPDPEAPTMGLGDGASNPGAGTKVGYFGDYELIEEIGRGGMGVVYKARQTSLNRVVALKMILTGQLANEDDVRRFHVEAEAAARLDHPGIVPVFEVGQHDGQHYFSMAFVEGESLAHRLAQGLPAPREAAELTRRVAEAVAYAHVEGVIHRDLKPANILLDKNGQPRLTDFGLAKRVEGDSNLTQTGQIVGTPSYMPPEQASGKGDAVGPLSDVYSLGAILYCLLTGRPPFQAATTFDTLLQVLEKEPVSPRQLNSSVPRDLETVCLKCLEKEPAKRYGSADALAEELERFVKGEPIQARPVGNVERLARWCRRNPIVATAAAVVLLLLATVAVVSTAAAISIAEARALAEDEARRNRKLADELGVSLTAEKAARDKADEQTRAARRSLYFAQINLAQNDWREAEIASMIDRLQAQRPTAPGQDDFRGFEWYYLWRLSHTDLRTFKGHTDQVYSVAFSPDGQRIVSGSMDRTVKVWDAATGQEVLSLKGHTTAVNSVAFSPDGQRIVSGGEDGRVWDAASGQQALTLKGNTHGVHSVAFSADGKRIVSGSGDQTVKVWDAATGQEIRTLRGHTDEVYSVAFSADGKRIVSGSGDQTVKVWDAATGQEIRTLKETDSVTDVAFSADGKRIVSGNGWQGQTVKVWDAQSGQELLSLKGHTSAIRSVAFSANGRLIVSGSWDRTVKVWDAATGQQILSLKGHNGGVFSVAFSADGKRIVSGSYDNTVKVWDAATGQEPLTFKGYKREVSSVAFSADGKRLVSSGSGDLTVRVSDAATGQEAISLKGHTNEITSVAFSADDKHIVSGSYDHTVKVWDAVTCQEALTLKGHSWYVTSVAFSADGKRIVSGGAGLDGQKQIVSGEVKVWDAATGQEAISLKGHTGIVTSVAFSADDKHIASSSHDQMVKLWDAATGQEILTLKGHTDTIYSVAFSPDGKRIVSGSGDNTVKVWDAATGQELLSFKGHAGAVFGVAFSRDGKRIVSGSYDETVRVWDAATGQEALSLKGHAGLVLSAAISADGKRIVSGCWDGTVGTVKIWDATPQEDR